MCCSFGDAYLIDRLTEGSGYSGMFDAIPNGNRDMLMAMLQYYAHEEGSDMHAAYWYQRANVASQRVSDLLRAFGFDDAHHSFLKAHIRFLAESTDDACYVLVDDTGSTGVCDVPITKAGNHDGVVTAVMRQIAVA